MKRDYRTTPMTSGAAPGYTGEGGHGPVSEPTFPAKQGCTCIAPRIYVGGKILDVCERCGKPFPRRRVKT